VADLSNGRLRKIVGRQVTTLAGGSEAGTAGAGAERASASPASWTSVDACSWRNSQRRARCGWLAPPAWIGPMDPAAEAAAEAQEGKALETAQTHTHTCGGGAGGKSSGNRARARAIHTERGTGDDDTPQGTFRPTFIIICVSSSSHACILLRMYAIIVRPTSIIIDFTPS